MTKMDDIIRQHTKEKLLVYREYLKNYLSVMCNVPGWKTIYVWEPFAGRGIYNSGTKGSVLQAAEIIKEFRTDYGKDI